jgi:hypothetical protein
MTKPTERDRQIAKRIFDAVHESCGLVSCDTGADIGWAPEEAIPIIAELLAESRAEIIGQTLTDAAKLTETLDQRHHDIPARIRAMNPDAIRRAEEHDAVGPNDWGWFPVLGEANEAAAILASGQADDTDALFAESQRDCRDRASRQPTNDEDVASEQAPTAMCSKCGGKTWQLINGLCEKCSPLINAAENASQ